MPGLFLPKCSPGDSSASVQINLSPLDVSQCAWTPADPSWAHSRRLLCTCVDELMRGCGINHSQHIVYIKKSNNWKIQIVSHKFSFQAASETPHLWWVNANCLILSLKENWRPRDQSCCAYCFSFPQLISENKDNSDCDQEICWGQLFPEYHVQLSGYEIPWK